MGQKPLSSGSSDRPPHVEPPDDTPPDIDSDSDSVSSVSSRRRDTDADLAATAAVDTSTTTTTVVSSSEELPPTPTPTPNLPRRSLLFSGAIVFGGFQRFTVLGCCPHHEFQERQQHRRKTTLSLTSSADDISRTTVDSFSSDYVDDYDHGNSIFVHRSPSLSIRRSASGRHRISCSSGVIDGNRLSVAVTHSGERIKHIRQLVHLREMNVAFSGRGLNEEFCVYFSSLLGEVSRPSAVLNGHHGLVTSLSISSSSSRSKDLLTETIDDRCNAETVVFASGSMDQTVQLWKIVEDEDSSVYYPKGRPEVVYYPTSVMSVRILKHQRYSSPGMKSGWFLSGLSDGSIRVADVSRPNIEVACLEDAGRWVEMIDELASAGDAPYSWISGSLGGVALWDPSTFRVTHRIPPPEGLKLTSLYVSEGCPTTIVLGTRDMVLLYDVRKLGFEGNEPLLCKNRKATVIAGIGFEECVIAGGRGRAKSSLSYSFVHLPTLKLGRQKTLRDAGCSAVCYVPPFEPMSGPSAACPDGEEISQADVEEGERFRKGGFGTIFKGTFRGQPIVIKKILVTNRSPPPRDYVLLSLVRREVRIMMELGANEHILKCLGWYHSTYDLGDPETESVACLLLEYCAGGDLSDWLHSRQVAPYLTPKIKIGVLYQIAEGLRFMHRKGICHKDLSLQNVLAVTDEPDSSFKICDFGLSRHEVSVTLTLAGTIRYIPFGATRESSASFARDVYAFGILSWEIWTKKLAFSHLGCEDSDLLVRLLQDPSLRPPLGDECFDMPDEVKAILAQCWQAEPSERPNFEVVVKQLQDCSL